MVWTSRGRGELGPERDSFGSSFYSPRKVGRCFFRASLCLCLCVYVYLASMWSVGGKADDIFAFTIIISSADTSRE